jgi:hypothetical protein
MKQKLQNGWHPTNVAMLTNHIDVMKNKHSMKKGDGIWRRATRALTLLFVTGVLGLFLC